MSKELKLITKTIEELIKELDLYSWSIKIKYCPNDRPDKSTIAEVDMEALYKTATITVYEIRKNKLKLDLRHELLHCKLGVIKESYETAIDNLVNVLKEALQGHEETIVEDFNRMLEFQKKKSKKK